jgi:hypothetical protein
MEYNSLKTIGKIHGFDGEAGTIISQNAEFIFNLQNVKNPDNIQDSTFVSFYPSTVKFGNEIHNVAREVEALTKDEIKKLQK